MLVGAHSTATFACTRAQTHPRAYYHTGAFVRLRYRSVFCYVLGELVEAGFVVVKAQWLQFTRNNAQGARIYKTLRGERFLNTSVISRIGKVALLPLPRAELQLSVAENQRILESAAGR